MGLYRRLLSTPALPWRIRKGFEHWTETRCRIHHAGLYRWLHFGKIRERVTAVTSGPKHHFFGYYDKSPWNAAGALLLAHEVPFNDRVPTADDSASVGVVHLRDRHRFEALGVARCWNWQQGAMLQWNPRAPDREFFYNDRRDGRFVAVLRDVHGKELRIYERPLYAISPDGKTACSLNFARLHTLRPGYGYAGAVDEFSGDPAPERDGIDRIDLTGGSIQRLVSLAELAARAPVDSVGAAHYVNHVQISPSGIRLAFFHIWSKDVKTWRTRLYTIRLDGSELSCVLDASFISHYDWLDDERILVWADKPGTGRHFLLCDQNQPSVRVVGDHVLTEDGHCSFSPDRAWVLNDTYPDLYDMRTLMLYRWPDGPRVDLARLHSPKARWWGEMRCDLHPRWRRDGKAICIDSVHSGERQMYVVDIQDVIA